MGVVKIKVQEYVRIFKDCDNSFMERHYLANENFKSLCNHDFLDFYVQEKTL